MNILDLFSGIGGFSLGLERAVMRTAAFCEIDPHARKVLHKHWPDVPVFTDVSTLSKANLNEQIDVLAGGFPCQDISDAGRGAGLSGSRSGLWFEYHRLIKEIQPRYAISKTSAPFAVEDWIKSSGHSLRSGMMRNGIVYPRQPLALLNAATASGSWPTPAARDYKGVSGAGRQERKGFPKDTLPNAVGGKPNPQWVEWLMGFPDKHTDLDS